MSDSKGKETKDIILIKALNLITKAVIVEGLNADEVIEQADQSGQDYILDFETNQDFNFIY